MQDSIERSIDIAASLDRVWQLVTEPGWWVPTDSAADTTGARTPGSVTVRESEKWGRFPVEVVSLDPQTYAAFRWASQFPGEDLAPGRTTLVEFRLALLDEGVRVTVRESGFASLDAPEDVRQAGIDSNSGGWEEELAALRTRAQL